MSIEENLEQLQREVQRKLGRNLLRLQQYERLIKAMIAEQDVAGYMGELQAVRARQVQAVAKKTLGQVVGELTGSLLVPAPVAPPSDDDNGPPANLDRPWLRVSFHIPMSAEDFLQTQERLAELVGMRNELVHHFLEKNDLWARDGCLDAERYLDVCFEQINSHYEELRGWAKANLEARERIGRFVESGELRDFMLHGILPGGAGVAWEECTIVRLLREAEAVLAVAGWSVLNEAIEYIRGRDPEHTPARYGCRTWRQVLHESKQFEVRKEQGLSGGPTVTLYRSLGR